MNAQGVIVGIVPSLGALIVFFLVIRGIIRADRNEREHLAQEERRAEAGHAATGNEGEAPQK